MKSNSNTIQYKLMRIILLTCSVVLVLMSGAFILFEYFTFREVLKKNLSTFALVIASNSTAALAFDSEKDASETLSSLANHQHIVVACLYDKDGRLFAKFPNNASPAALPVNPGTGGYSFEKAFLQGFQPVIQNGHALGTLYIKRDLRDMDAQMRRNALIAFFMILLSMFIAWLLSNILQQAISKPILALEETARKISQNNDYSVRAKKMAEDEVGSLTNAFNQMLSQIEAQTVQIRSANEESTKLAAIVESSGDAIIGTSSELLVISWNDSAERIIGYTADEMIGQPVARIISPDLYESTRNLLAAGLENDGHVDPFETQIATKERKILDISLSISAIKNTDGSILGFSLIGRDISVQKQNERTISQNEEHLRLATEAAELGIFDMDLENNVMNWDKRCRQLFGIGHDEPLNFEDHFVKRLHEEDRARVTERFYDAFDAAKGKGKYEGEYRTIGPDDKQRWIRAIGNVFFDEDGKAVRSVGILLDITGKKTEEIKKNDFIAVISHELRTPLTSVKSYVQILLAKAKKEDDKFRTTLLTRAEIQSNRMASMIDDFLNLSRIEEGKIRLVTEVFDLGPLLADVRDEMLLLTSTHQIVLNDCPGILIKADKNKIGQVLINLLSNAIKYSPAGTTVTVDCRQLDGRAIVAVSDQGVGISENDQKKLFERFFRVENQKMKTVSGFGIGLYIVAEILRYHGSQIEVNSREGHGSTFSFSLDSID